VKLETRSWGSGERTALLIHGLFSDSSSWYRIGPALAERGYRVIAPDLRGHGRSGRGRYSVIDWSMDVLTSIDEPPDLAIGHSLGGLVLGIIAEALGARAAVYLDPAWRMDAAQDADFREEWRGWLQWTSPEQLRAHLGSRWPERDLQLRWDSMRATDPAVVPGLARGGGFDYSPERATMPSLVLAADPSGFITPEHAAELTARGLVVQRVSDSGHSYFREDAEGFLRTLDQWRADGR
jgi:pimeloyl-ACP methyl ester carboxylesterase